MGLPMSRPALRRPVAADRVDDLLAPSAYRIQAMIDGLDQVATAMELTWGIDRLRLLVPDALRARFDQQKDRLDTAIGR